MPLKPLKPVFISGCSRASSEFLTARPARRRRARRCGDCAKWKPTPDLAHGLFACPRSPFVPCHELQSETQDSGSLQTLSPSVPVHFGLQFVGGFLWIPEPSGCCSIVAFAIVRLSSEKEVTTGTTKAAPRPSLFKVSRLFSSRPSSPCSCLLGFVILCPPIWYADALGNP